MILDERKFELGSALLTGILFILIGYKYRKQYIICFVLFWSVYILCKKDKLSEWGLDTKNIRSSFLVSTTYFVVVLIGIILYLKIINNSNIIVNQNFMITLVLYLLWGILQQFIIQSMIIRNIKNIFNINNTILLLLLGAVLFSIVHINDKTLLILTFFMGLIWTHIYLEHKNIIPIGIYHGILGTIYYYWIIKKDILKEVL